jgi:tetratricopeptide (TPR) repeat protein
MRREAGAGVHFGRFAEARRLLSKALAGLDGVASAPALAERAEICSWQAMVELRLGRPAAATAWARRAVEGADDADAPTALGRGLMVLDLALVEQGRLDEATHGERALEVFERLGDLNQQAFVWNNLGLVAFYRGRWDEALACYARAKEAWERTGDRASVTFADVNMGEILTGQGRHDEADALLRNALRAARAARNDADVGYVLRELGTIDLRRGNVDAALEQLSAAAAACEAAGDAPAALEAKARIAETHLLAGRIRQAREAAETALVRARAEGGALTTPALLRVLGQVAAAEGDADGAAGHLAEALAAGEAANHAFERTLALACIAELGEAGGATATVRRRRDDLVATLGIVELPPLGRLGET